MIKSISSRIYQSKIAKLFIRTVLKWKQDECLEMGAALAYYALFSLFPILMVILSIFGLVLGTKTKIYQQLLLSAQAALPPEAYKMVESTLQHLNQSSVGAGLIGFAILFVTASKIFEALDKSVDKIWQVHEYKQRQQPMAAMILTVVKDKILAFLMVLSSAAVIFLSFISNIAVKIILELVQHFEAAISWIQVDDLLVLKGLQVSISLMLLTSVVMVLFKILPSTRIHWSDIWLGALVTVGLLMLLQNLVSNGVIKIGEQFQAYGVIGNVMVLLLWIYLTCQVFFLGCEFTYVYAHLWGSRRSPEED